MTQRIRLFGVWSALAFLITLLVAFGFIAGWIPPIAPSAGAQEVAAHFRERSVPIRIAMVFMSIGCMFYLPWTVLLSELIRDIEGRSSSFLATTQLVGGALCVVTFFLPAYLWTTAAFRPERNPEITQALADLGWLIFITAIGPFLLQCLVLAVAIFGDKRPTPAFPRWSAYLQIWVSVSVLPAVFAFFMKTGPFAWNGLFVWWVPLTMFGAWFAVMARLAYKAVMRADSLENLR